MPRTAQPRQTPPRQQGSTYPCGQQRDITDIAGRINDLINCYLLSGADKLKQVIPLVIIAVILLAVMILAAREFLKG